MEKSADTEWKMKMLLASIIIKTSVTVQSLILNSYKNIIMKEERFYETGKRKVK